MILDHTGIIVSDYEQSKSFYTQALAPLGIFFVLERNGWAGFGKKNHPELWFAQGKEPLPFMHLAFRAESKEQIAQFYEAALAAGASCNGKPALRHDYYSRYYGAFVLDPDGYNIGVVSHPGE